MNHWDAAYLAASPFFLGNAYLKRRRHGKYRRSLPGMFGANLPYPPLPAHRERLWLHAVSVGETVAAAAVFRHLRAARPQWQFLATTTTETGQDHARTNLPADYHDFAPIDYSWKVRAFLDAYRPSGYLFFETELWPNALLECARRGLPVVMINGKLSARSARRYEQLSRLFRAPLGAVRLFLMQSDADAERMRRIVGPEANIQVAGNVKFDSLPEPLDISQRSDLRQNWGLNEEEFLVLAGSTHPGEEALVLQAFAAVKARHRQARLLVAPRHPERFEEAEEDLAKGQWPVHCLSQGSPPDGDSILLLDRMGVLAHSFGAADLALIGGSWNPIGGHNVLEPAVHGVPVIHGPHMHEQKELMRIVELHDATLMAPREDLAAAILRLMDNEGERQALAERGRVAARANRGAAQRVAEQVLELFGN